MAVFALDVSSLAHVDCLLGEQSPQTMFYALWWFKIAGLPLVLMIAATVYCTLAPVESWTSAFSLVLFLVCEFLAIAHIVRTRKRVAVFVLLSPLCRPGHVHHRVVALQLPRAGTR